MLSFAEFVTESKGWMSPDGKPSKVNGYHAYEHHPDVWRHVDQEMKAKYPGKRNLSHEQKWESVAVAQKKGFARFGREPQSRYCYVHYDHQSPGGKDSALFALSHLKPKPGERILIHKQAGSGRIGSDHEFRNPHEAAEHISESFILESNPDERDTEYQNTRKHHNFVQGLPEPGHTPIPDDHIRLYHQTSAENANHIKTHGIQMSHAKGIEGPKAVWADPQGFYGHPSDHPTVEFHIPKKDWNSQGHIHRSIEPHEIIAVHLPWHKQARYIVNHPETHAAVLKGKHDDLLSNSRYGPAIQHIKKHHPSITEAHITHADRFHGIITHKGKVIDKNTGYNPGCHHELAIKHGYKDANHLLYQGGVRFAQYEGGADYQPGNRIEYEYRHPNAKKHIIKHIQEHPTTGGYSIYRRGQTPSENDSDFTEHRTAAHAINHLRDSNENTGAARRHLLDT